ncbi:unnamed protein product [Cladocopium goreaui]|uniref:Uncharacterized protein n=1 Tax=Cladocopium goreaui TaxID=2562237 RepID=A0A9P1D5K0_9DINO|nr:unnamed protein product [Cladocopium goreaui]
MAEELRSRSPRAGYEAEQDQVQKQEQLEASKQAIVSSWPDSAGPADRTQAVEQLVNRHDNVKGKYASTTTLRTKQRWSQFSIAEFLTKEARNEFVELVGKDALICHEQIAVGRAQLRGGLSGFPFGVLSTEIGPAGALAFGAAEVAFGDTGAAWVAFWDWWCLGWRLSWDLWRGLWSQWRQNGTTRRADGCKPQDFFNIHIETPAKQTAAALDTQHATLQHQRKQTHTKDEDDEMDGGLPDLRRQRKGEGKHAAQRRQ